MSAQGAITGAVYLCEYDSERAEIIYGIQKRIRALSITIGIVATLLAAGYVFRLMGRLQDLVRSMRAVAGGDYAYRHPIRGRDEISELGEEFNRLHPPAVGQHRAERDGPGDRAGIRRGHRP